MVLFSGRQVYGLAGAEKNLEPHLLGSYLPLTSEKILSLSLSVSFNEEEVTPEGAVL